MAYASRCSGATAEAMRAAGWGMLIEPGSRPARPFPGMPWVLDNGAWSAFVNGHEWNQEPFEVLVRAFGPGSDWVAAPDIVAGGLTSLARSESWLPRLLPSCRLVLVPVQDGMVANDLRSIVGNRVGLFVGGTTEWKLATLGMWGRLSKESGCHLHVARVNTPRRIRLCQDAGAHSFDGTSVTRFRVNLCKIDAARRQGVLCV